MSVTAAGDRVRWSEDAVWWPIYEWVLFEWPAWVTRAEQRRGNQLCTRRDGSARQRRDTLASFPLSISLFTFLFTFIFYQHRSVVSSPHHPSGSAAANAQQYPSLLDNDFLSALPAVYVLVPALAYLMFFYCSLPIHINNNPNPSTPVDKPYPTPRWLFRRSSAQRRLHRLR